MAVTINGGKTERSTPVANTNADVTLEALPNTIYTIVGILASYSAVPTGGRIGVVIGALPGTIAFDLDITQAGPIQLPFNLTEDLVNTQVTVRLFAGGVGVIGKLTVAYIESFIQP